MVKLGRLAGAVALLVVTAAVPAWAQKTTSNEYRYWNVCGGNSFYTCAAVDIELVADGQIVMRVWNLAGELGPDYANAVFTGVGFFNTGAVSPTIGSLSMSGPARPGDSPDSWVLDEDKQIGGGVNLDLVSKTDNGVDDGIITECAVGGTSPLPGGSNDLWMNPCGGLDWNSNAGWIVFNFDFSGDWNFDTTELLVKAQNGGPDGNLSTECITGQNCGTDVTPEPVTVVLLGSGLLGIAGAGARRRRRENGDDTLA